MARAMSVKKREEVRSHVIRARDEVLAALRVLKEQPRGGSDLQRLKLAEEMAQAAEALLALGVTS